MTPTNNGDDWKKTDLSIDERIIPDVSPVRPPKPRSVPPAAIAPSKAEPERVRAGGWITLYRSMQNHWLSKNRPYCYRAAWEWLLCEAAHSDHMDHRGRLQRRGVVFTSQFDGLDKAWGWDRKKVRKFLHLLQADGMITFETDRRVRGNGTTIEITNYKAYQSQLNVRVPDGVSTSPNVVRAVPENSPSTFHRGNVGSTPHHSSSQLPINSPQHNNATKQRLSKQTEIKATHYMCRMCGKVRVARANASCNTCVPY